MDRIFQDEQEVPDTTVCFVRTKPVNSEASLFILSQRSVV
jgi:hypothetical protein